MPVYRASRSLPSSSSSSATTTTVAAAAAVVVERRGQRGGPRLHNVRASHPRARCGFHRNRLTRVMDVLRMLCARHRDLLRRLSPGRSGYAPGPVRPGQPTVHAFQTILPIHRDQFSARTAQATTIPITLLTTASLINRRTPNYDK